jgi:hypothetical protein
LVDNGVREQKGFMSEEQFDRETTRLTLAERGGLLKVLKKHLVAFEWKHGDREGLLIPDLLPERTVPAKWQDGICQATLRFRGVFLGEPHFFEFLSRHERLIKRLDLNEAEARMVIRPIGVFRNEVCLCRQPCEALVQIDVVESRIDVTVRGGTMEEASRFREQIIGSLTYLDHASLGEPREGDAVATERWPLNAKILPVDSSTRCLFRRSTADQWRVSFGTDPNVYVLDHLEGLTYIAQLLGQPDTAISDVRLCGKGSEDEIRMIEDESVLPAIEADEKAYLLQELHAAMELSKNPDPKIAEKGWDNIAAIKADLGNRVTASGRSAMNNSNHKRAQHQVTKALESAYRRLEVVSEGALVSHLKAYLTKSDKKAYRRIYRRPVGYDWDVSWIISNDHRSILPGG